MQIESEVKFREGIEALTKSNADQAIMQLRQVLREAKKSNHLQNKGWSLLRIAMILRGQRQYAAALEVLEDARNVFADLDDLMGKAAVLQELSLANRELHRNTLALEYAHQALELLESQPRTLELGWVYDNQSIIYLNLFHRHESLVFAKKAREIFSQFKSQSSLAWNASNLGILYYEMGFHDEAAKYSSEALSLFTDLNNKQGMAWSLLSLGIIQRAQCQFKKAETTLTKAKDIYTALDLKDRTGWCLLNQAAIKRATGNNEEAVLLNRRAIQLFGPIRNNDGVGWSLFQIGQIFRDRGQFVKAWETFREALTFHSDIANRKGMGWTENDIGKSYLDLNDLAHARESLVKAKVIAEHLGLTPLKLEVDKNLGFLLLEEGFLQRAKALIDESEFQSRKLNAKDYRVEMLLEQARYHLTVGDNVKARSVLNQAKTLADENGLRRLFPTVNLYWGELLMTTGDVPGAIRVWKEVVEQATQMHQRPQRAEALLGLVQAFLNQSPLPSLEAILDQISKEIKLISSRKLRAKYLVVRGMVEFKRNAKLDMSSFNQSLKILKDAGLRILELRTTQFLQEMYAKAGKAQGKTAIEKQMKRLLENGPADLSALSRPPAQMNLQPVSVVL